MNGPKPVASLGPLLLARKGTAKPAMRAQLGESDRGNVTDIDEMRELAASQEDLGWNDMGDDLPEPQESPARRQQTALIHHIADANQVAANETDGIAQPRRSAKSQGRRAAFTLRLDDELHLKLKLAATVEGESAQKLVTRALAEMLGDMPEIEALAAQVQRKNSKS